MKIYWTDRSWQTAHGQIVARIQGGRWCTDGGPEAINLRSARLGPSHPSIAKLLKNRAVASLAFRQFFYFFEFLGLDFRNGT